MRVFSIAKRINKKITIHKASEETDEAFLTESYNFDLPFFWKFTYIPRYIRFFNSFEAHKLPDVKSTKYKYKNAPQLYKETNFKFYAYSRIYEYLDNLSIKIEDYFNQYSFKDSQVPINTIWAVDVLR